MKKSIIFLSIAAVLLTTSVAWAADRLLSFSIADAMNDPKIQNELIDDVKIFWSQQSHPAVAKKYGEFKSSKRTSKLGKAIEAACRWALASSLIAMQERALKEGGNAVVNIRSNVNNNESDSPTEFNCMVGDMMVNSAVKGDVVKLK